MHKNMCDVASLRQSRESKWTNAKCEQKHKRKKEAAVEEEAEKYKNRT